MTSSFQRNRFHPFGKQPRLLLSRMRWWQQRGSSLLRNSGRRGENGAGLLECAPWPED